MCITSLLSGVVCSKATVRGGRKRTQEVIVFILVLESLLATVRLIGGQHLGLHAHALLLALCVIEGERAQVLRVLHRRRYGAVLEADDCGDSEMPSEVTPGGVDTVYLGARVV